MWRLSAVVSGPVPDPDSVSGVDLRSKVAVVGHSGSGKSTLARLLYRFYDVNSGRVSVNGKVLATPAHVLAPGDQVKVDGKALPEAEKPGA